MTIIDDRLDQLPPLKSGAHRSIEDGACLLEAVAWLAGEPWSDHPEELELQAVAMIRDQFATAHADVERRAHEWDARVTP